MIHFSKLRLSGFKSFVEKTELDIGNGLTGIVGPNGCGKSNLVEALRWVMGENSPKSMRGDGMEDVIFAGTARRPARNFAEVTLILDNAEHKAPPPYTNFEQIEVSRKIEKDKGSTYKINGRTVRQRDVTLLFADTMSGASSPALVSQGRIAQMISAKPIERRQVLEESAGISGLYRRRHEAELKLRAAEKNLERVEDVTNSLQARLSTLKRQARQAEKYKELSSKIRELNIMLAYLEWKQAHDHLKSTENILKQTESLVADRLTVVSQLTQKQVDYSKNLPALRQNEAKINAAYQSQRVMINRLEEEKNRILSQIEEHNLLLSQIEEDKKHEASTADENTSLLTKLDTEEECLNQEIKDGPSNMDSHEKEKKEFEKHIAKLEEKYAALMQEGSDRRAKETSIISQIKRDRNLLEIAKRSRSDAAQMKQKKQDERSSLGNLDEIEKTLHAITTSLEDLKNDTEKKITRQGEMQDERDDKLGELRDAQNDVKAIEREIKTLNDILTLTQSEDFRPVLEDLQVKEGFEAALSRAIGDHVMGSLNPEAPIYWTVLNTTQAPALPNNINSLNQYVTAPKALNHVLSFIGVAETTEEAQQNHSSLKPGQILVTKDGGCWRWDGLVIKAEAGDSHTARLKQKNRLHELEKELPALKKRQTSLEATYEHSANKLSQLKNELIINRNNIRESEQSLAKETRERENLIRKTTYIEQDIVKYQEKEYSFDSEVARLEENIEVAQDTLESFLKDDSAAEHETILTNLQDQLKSKRTGLQDTLLSMEKIIQEQSRRKARLHAIADERLSLKNRTIRAKEQLKNLEIRAKTTGDKLKSVKDRPEEIKAELQTILSSMGELESRRNNASDTLGKAEVEFSEINKNLKDAEKTLSESRESRALAQGTLNAANETVQEKVDSVQRQFEMPPPQLLQHCSLLRDEDGNLAEMPSLESIRAQREKNIRDRDMIGPVNLQADSEALEVEKELTQMLNEKNDLTQAIDELRFGIQKLNKEARERLKVAFDHVNGHFTRLFTRLFGGGNAHLALVDSDDPLEAGLEIFAQPPGKSLQSLSLMSGGEQTLSSTALIFAMFLTNPSPICVLDEVDAPLDDANVDRVCNLIEEISEQSQTRFLIITHHRLTMARMDRLYGVTMAERGVSQLVSVDMTEEQLDLLDEQLNQANGT